MFTKRKLPLLPCTCLCPRFRGTSHADFSCRSCSVPPLHSSCRKALRTALHPRCLAVPGASAVRLVAATSASVQRGDGQQILVDRLLQYAQVCGGLGLGKRGCQQREREAIAQNRVCRGAGLARCIWTALAVESARRVPGPRLAALAETPARQQPLPAQARQLSVKIMSIRSRDFP